KEDLDSAAVRLANTPGEVGAYYPTIDAVKFLYARYYLDVEDYDNAIEYANQVISSGKYTLAKTKAEMEAEYQDDSGTEPIMQMYGSKSEMPGSVTIYTGMGGDDKYGVVSNALFLPTKKLVEAYDANDLRKAQWFSTTKFYTKVNGNYYRGDFHSFVKYYGNPALQTNKVYNGCQMSKPYKISEMYLIKAEAQAQKGNIPGAKGTLKILQTARGANQTSGQLEDVQLEWFRETPGEGLRLSCLKRWHEGFAAREGQSGAVNKNVLMTGENYTGRSWEADDYHFVWPIPAGEIRLNENLEQNENYGRQ
ncbi:MAG: RagB/SusD family nutrient uptake outer membrane protein, partial [Bacteroidales bacterium]|nr:RagB/SusD family nutrient uptake outer membrane protein [Bacteroidales bacterium]